MQWTCVVWGGEGVTVQATRLRPCPWVRAGTGGPSGWSECPSPNFNHRGVPCTPCSPTSSSTTDVHPPALLTVPAAVLLLCCTAAVLLLYAQVYRSYVFNRPAFIEYFNLATPVGELGRLNIGGLVGRREHAV